ncbi:uncharacterized protein A4U43_C02F18520 [Asparagus officinalis]|uniref:Uncharacterized protein n=1 Tax=Asparagus officinalis TaxID=4686 RepID=A0A5P1FK11_ASPOF|nr:uncharacterized protein A4U43_C02F18520 [Asparagus officinalis]
MVDKSAPEVVAHVENFEDDDTSQYIVTRRCAPPEVVNIEIEREVLPPEEFPPPDMADIEIEREVPAPGEGPPLDMANIDIEREVFPPMEVPPLEVEFFC